MTLDLRALPKAELHLHIEGTLEPELMFTLAERNRVPLPFADVDEARGAYVFADLQSFLDVYYAGCSVLITAEDFHDLTAAYLRRAADDGVRHAEIFFDPQTHTARGVAMATVVEGITGALAAAERDLGVTSGLILCFLRHLPVADAMATLDASVPHREQLTGVGLDSAERDHPPGEFREVFARARALGLRAVADAGEEGPAAYVREALDELGVERIDHGVRCLEDDALVERLVADEVPLTVCPLSNVRLRVVPDLAAHPLRRMLERGLRVTVNSDDPAYFGGYVTRNYEETAAALDLADDQLIELARNSFRRVVPGAGGLPPAPGRRRRVRGAHPLTGPVGVYGRPRAAGQDAAIPSLASSCSRRRSCWRRARRVAGRPRWKHHGPIVGRASSADAPGRPRSPSPRRSAAAFIELALESAVPSTSHRAVLERWARDPTVHVAGAPTPADLMHLDEARQRWSLMTGLHITETAGTGDVTVHFVPRAEFGKTLGVDHVDPTAVGLTRVRLEAGRPGVIDGANVAVATDDLQVARNRTIAHELGHAIGLQHSTCASSLMDGSTDPGRSVRWSPSALDVRIGALLYDARLRPGMDHAAVGHTLVATATGGPTCTPVDLELVRAAGTDRHYFCERRAVPVRPCTSDTDVEPKIPIARPDVWTDGATLRARPPR